MTVLAAHDDESSQFSLMTSTLFVSELVYRGLSIPTAYRSVRVHLGQEGKKAKQQSQ